MKKWRRHVAGAPDGVIRSILAAAFLLPIAACTVGPDFTAPLAPLAENFRGADNRSVKSGPREYERWWEGFRDPTLNRLTQIAYNQNLTLLSAGTRVLQARAVLGIAIGIAYPQVQQGVGSVIYNRTSAATPLDVIDPDQSESIFSLRRVVPRVSSSQISSENSHWLIASFDSRGKRGPLTSSATRALADGGR